MNNQTGITNPSTVSNNAGTTTNIASSESVPAAVTDKPQTATDQGDAGNAQTTNQSGSEEQVKPDTSATVKLELSEEQADMIQTLLSNYVIAYRSDSSVDYKPEPIPREKVGHFPYVATAPAPEIINPTYDWINKKWYSKTNATDLSEIAQDVQSLQSNQEVGTNQSLALTKAVKQLSEGQADQEKLLASVIASAQKTAEPTAPTQSTQATNK